MFRSNPKAPKLLQPAAKPPVLSRVTHPDARVPTGGKPVSRGGGGGSKPLRGRPFMVATLASASAASSSAAIDQEGGHTQGHEFDPNLSPIPNESLDPSANGRPNLISTGLREGDVGSRISPEPVPFDPLEALDSTRMELVSQSRIVTRTEQIDRGARILFALQVLSRRMKLDKWIRLRHIEESQVGGGGGDVPRSHPTPTTPRKKQGQSAAANSELDFNFTKDMFRTNNTKALIASTHLIFGAIDGKQTEVCFRDCWPPFEKQQEAEYRKKALAWASEICEKNKEFFNGVKPTVAMFVSPSGEKFMQFMHLFVHFAVYTINLERSRKLGKEPEIKKILSTGDTEVDQKRMIIQKHKVNELIKATIDLDKIAAVNNILHEENKRDLRAKKQEYERWMANQVRSLRALVNSRPNLFPKDAIERVEARHGMIDEVCMDRRVAPPAKKFVELPDPLCSVLDIRWKESLSQMQSSITEILSFSNVFGPLLKFNEHSSNQTVLDAKTLAGAYTEGQTQPLELKDFIKYLSTEVLNFNEIIKKAGSVPNEMIKRIESQKVMLQELAGQSKQKDEDDVSASVSEDTLNEILFKIKSLSVKLNETDWTKLINIHDSQSQSDFILTPPRQFGTDRATGLTPAIAGFLDFSVSEPSHADLVENNRSIETQIYSSKNVPGPSKSGVKDIIWNSKSRYSKTIISRISEVPDKRSIGIDETNNEPKGTTSCELDLEQGKGSEITESPADRGDKIVFDSNSNSPKPSSLSTSLLHEVNGSGQVAQNNSSADRVSRIKNVLRFSVSPISSDKNSTTSSKRKSSCGPSARAPASELENVSEAEIQDLGEDLEVALDLDLGIMEQSMYDFNGVMDSSAGSEFEDWK